MTYLLTAWPWLYLTNLFIRDHHGQTRFPRFVTLAYYASIIKTQKCSKFATNLQQVGQDFTEIHFHLHNRHSDRHCLRPE